MEIDEDVDDSLPPPPPPSPAAQPVAPPSYMEVRPAMEVPERQQSGSIVQDPLHPDRKKERRERRERRRERRARRERRNSRKRIKLERKDDDSKSSS